MANVLSFFCHHLHQTERIKTFTIMSATFLIENSFLVSFVSAQYLEAFSVLLFSSLVGILNCCFFFLCLSVLSVMLLLCYKCSNGVKYASSSQQPSRSFLPRLHNIIFASLFSFLSVLVSFFNLIVSFSRNLFMK